MCKNALGGKPANSHLDDLESFYWVLCFMVCFHDGPGLSSSQPVLSPEMKLLVTVDFETAAHGKSNHFALPFGLPLASFWGRSIVRLMRNLHLFFHKRILAQEHAEKDPPPHDPGADYKEILSYFSLAIQELGVPNPDTTCTLMETIETKRYRLGVRDL